jgi:hypothetical protein
MQNPETTHQQYQRTSTLYSLIQWGSGILALSLPLLTTTFTGTQMHQARIAAAIAGGGLCIVGNLSRKEYEKMAETTDRLSNALADNTVAWVHTLTQPTRTALRQTQSFTEGLNPPPLFDWSELANGDEHPVIAIVSPMGGGKSRLAKWLARHVIFPAQEVDIAAIDIYGRKKDWSTVASTPQDILELMREDLLILQTREGNYREGQDNFAPMFRIFEEAPDTLTTLSQIKDAQKNTLTPWLIKYTTTTRKVKARMCLISVKLAGVEIGLSAETRNDATIVFPGLKGIAKAMGDERMLKLGTKANKPLRDQLLAALDGLRHPALIFHQGAWYPAAIPELDAHGNTGGQTYHPELSEYIDSISTYLKEHPEVSNRDLKKTWGRNNGANAQTVDQLLAVLENYQKICQENGVIKWLQREP